MIKTRLASAAAAGKAEKAAPAVALRALGSLAIWVLIVLACWGIGELAALVNVPAPHMLISILIGAGLAIGGVVRKQVPRKMNIAAQCAVGVVMGGYLDLGSLADVGNALASLSAAIVATIGLCLVAGWMLQRLIPVDARDSVLGMVPGGSAAIISLSGDLGADSRVVAFMQYLRIAIVAASAPLIVSMVGHQSSAEPHSSPGRVALDLANNLKLVDSPDQLLGTGGLIGLCVVGYFAAKWLRLPAAATVGPMLLAATVYLILPYDFSPSPLAKEFLFVMVGLEIGLRFTRASLRQIWRLVPGVFIAIVTVAVASAGVAALLSIVIHTTFLDAYLATTPGGINAVLAAAVNADANLSIISTVQTLRLFLIVLLTPFFLRWMATRLNNNATRLKRGRIQMTSRPDNPLVDHDKPLAAAEAGRFA